MCTAAGRKRREVKGGNSWFHCAVAINLNSTFTSEKEVTAAAAAPKKSLIWKWYSSKQCLLLHRVNKEMAQLHTWTNFNSLKRALKISVRIVNCFYVCSCFFWQLLTARNKWIQSLPLTCTRHTQNQHHFGNGLLIEPQSLSVILQKDKIWQWWWCSFYIYSHCVGGAI